MPPQPDPVKKVVLVSMTQIDRRGSGQTDIALFAQGAL